MTKGGKGIEMRELMMHSRLPKYQTQEVKRRRTKKARLETPARIHPPLHSDRGSLNLISDVKGSSPLVSAGLSDPTDSRLLN